MKNLNFNNQKNNLSQSDIDQILGILTYRCRIGTFNRLKSILKYGPSLIPSYGILDRLMKEDGRWSYCAGQSYTDEIRTIRKIILTGK